MDSDKISKLFAVSVIVTNFGRYVVWLVTVLRPDGVQADEQKTEDACVLQDFAFIWTYCQQRAKADSTRSRKAESNERHPVKHTTTSFTT